MEIVYYLDYYKHVNCGWFMPSPYNYLTDRLLLPVNYLAL